MSENEKIKCTRCNASLPEKFDDEVGNYSAYDSPVWETSYYILPDSVPDQANWIGFHDVEGYFLCPKCRKIEEAEDLREQQRRQEKQEE